MPRRLLRNLACQDQSAAAATACHKVCTHIKIQCASQQNTWKTRSRCQDEVFAQYTSKRATCIKFTTHCSHKEIRAHQRPPPSPERHEIYTSNQGFQSPAPPRKVDFKQTTKTREVTTKFANAHGTTTRAQTRKSLVQACAVEMHFEDLDAFVSPAQPFDRLSVSSLSLELPEVGEA